MSTDNVEMLTWKSQVDRNQDTFDLRLQHVEKTTNQTAMDVKTLLDRDSAREKPVGWKAIVAGVISTGVSLGLLWQWVSWSVENAPVTRRLDDRIIRMETESKQNLLMLDQRTAKRFTQDDALIACLREEIANATLGYVCAHPRRGNMPKGRFEWAPQIKKPGPGS